MIILLNVLSGVIPGVLQTSHEDEAQRPVEEINDKISWGRRP